MIKINKSIVLNNIKFNYLLTINPRAKNIKISIGCEGMKVTIPKGINMDFVQRFLHSKEDWIIKHLNIPKEEMNNQLYFEGNIITYNVLSGLKENSISFKDNVLNINLIKELNYDEIHAIIKSWYLKQATDSFNKSIKVYSQIIGVKYNRICLREQKTRWGSCSSKANLNFNWKLIMAPKFVLDYIVVHELCHLIHMNHSKSFWSEVDRFIPDYKSAELWLKLNSRKLNF
ncbi:MAG: M48 family metallopeptidase [Clostridiaceae bacterium]|nr:M48 family metallopeptidase [Clostridiaceae bacterium]